MTSLLFQLEVSIDYNDWFLFLDESISSFKAVLIHKVNLKTVPVAFSKSSKESFSLVSEVLSLIKYSKYQWDVSADFKVIAMLTGMQSGYTQYNCFLCQWISREKDQYSIINWPLRTSRKIGEFNIANPTLIDPKKILLPPTSFKTGNIQKLRKKPWVLFFS